MELVTMLPFGAGTDSRTVPKDPQKVYPHPIDTLNFSLFF